MTASRARILVVDDDLSMRQFLEILLTREGYTVATAPSAEVALQHCETSWPELVLTDLNMPGMSGLDLLGELKTRAARRGEDIEVVMVTAYATAESAIEALKRGARDYVRKPFNNDELKLIIRRALEQHTLEQENLRLKTEVQDQLHFGHLIGSSPPMQAVYDMVRRVKDTPINCLVVGESGTGKELVARAIHDSGLRRGGFVAVNCGAIPENLVESELFGHVRGAFSGAARDKEGLVAAADRGTLFLDEVNSLPLSAQVKLLRVLQERVIERVGDLSPRPVDIRVVNATNKDLEEEIRAGRFREDLYYRLNEVAIQLPPLRDRGDDIHELARFFLQKYAEQYGSRATGFTNECVRAMLSFYWPGNVRQLENRVKKAVIMSDRALLNADDLGIQASDKRHIAPLDEATEDFKKGYIRDALQLNNWNKAQTARDLGVDPRTIFRYIEKMDD